MSANTAAGALSRFLNSTADAPGVLIERIAGLLHEAGDVGLELPRVLELSGLSRADLFTALSAGQNAGLLETREVDGTALLFLGPVGRSLF